MTTEFKRGQFANVVYHSKAKQETTQRAIIPTLVPGSVLRAIDVTELSPEHQIEMQELYAEYDDYYKLFVASAYNFETWAEHTKGKIISPKWRALLLSNIKESI